jgi:hypothetical protein
MQESQAVIASPKLCSLCESFQSPLRIIHRGEFSFRQEKNVQTNIEPRSGG